MTPDEALYHIRKDLADAVDRVVGEHVGNAATLTALAPYAEKLRNAADLDEGAALADEVKKISIADPPVYDRINALTQGVREQAEAETIPGQIKSATKTVKTGVELAEIAIGLYLLWKLFGRG